MAEELHLNDTGTVFEIILKDGNTPVDISTATVKQFVFQKPGTPKVIITKTANFVTDGVDGKLQYITLVGDLDVIGTWKVQAKVTLPSWEGSSSIASFKVYANLV